MINNSFQIKNNIINDDIREKIQYIIYKISINKKKILTKKRKKDSKKICPNCNLKSFNATKYCSGCNHYFYGIPIIIRLPKNYDWGKKFISPYKYHRKNFIDSDIKKKLKF